MIEDELIKIWQSSSNQERIKFEKSKLMLEMQSNIDNFHKKIRYRDIRETIAALIVIAVFIYYAFVIPFTISKIASVLIAIWAGYIIIYLRKTASSKPSEYHENYLTYLTNNRQYLKEQKKLLDTVLWWYLIPFLFCSLLFLSGFIGVPEKIYWIISTLVGCVILSVIIYVMNKKYAKGKFQNKIDKLESLIETLQSSDV